MTAPIGIALSVLALALLGLVAGTRRATRPLVALRPGPGPIDPPLALRESPESIAARVCRDLAVATSGGRCPGAVVGRLVVEAAEYRSEPAWVVRVGPAVRHIVPDLHALEAALVHELRRSGGDERDVRSGWGGA